MNKANIKFFKQKQNHILIGGDNKLKNIPTRNMEGTVGVALWHRDLYGAKHVTMHWDGPEYKFAFRRSETL